MPNVQNAVPERINALIGREVGVTQARNEFRNLVDQVQHQGETYLIRRHGRPAVAIVPVKVYEDWREERKKFFEFVRQAQRQANLEPNAAEKIAVEAAHWARSTPNPR
jgi:prevent-host-death family protein